MRKLLLSTVAAAAIAGYAGSAPAQTMQNPASGAGAGAAAKSENTKPAESQGALSGALKGDTKGDTKAQTPGQTPAKSVEGPSQSAKPDRTLGQDQPKQMTSPRNAEEEKPDAKTQKTGQKTGEDSGGARQQRGAQDETTKPGANSAAQSADKSGNSHNSVQLSQTQRTKIQAIVGRSSAARVSHVDFDVSVGVKIPSDVHIEVLPTQVVEVVPEYRGYDYIIVGDNILIIDPDTLEIVDIIAV